MDELSEKGYILCDYIESTGVQYIDTGIIPDGDTRVVMECHTTDTASSVNRWIMGCNDSATEDRFEIINIASDNSVRFYHHTSNSTFTGIGLGRMSIDVSLSSASINDVSLTITEEPFGAVNSMLLFSGQTTGEVYDGMPMKLYSCQIYSGDTLVRDFVPVVTESGTAGLYDMANDVFYTSPNGNGFIAKVQGSELPVGYTKCEYIESNGTQYVDTGISISPENGGSLKYVIDAAMLSPTSGASLNGSGWGASPYMNSFYVGWYDGEVWYGNGREDVHTGVMVADTQKHTFTYDAKNGLVEISDVYSSSFEYQVPDSALSLILFGYSQSTKITTHPSKVYGCQIYDNDELVRDFIPCQDTEGEYGLYDKVNDVFYPSANGVNFTGKWSEPKELKVSPQEFRHRLLPKEDSTLPKGYYLCEYIESDGTQYVDTGIKPNQDTRVIVDVDVMEQASYPKALFGGRNGDTSNVDSFVVWTFSASTFRTDFGAANVTINISLPGRFLIDKNKAVTTINGTEYTNTEATFQAVYNLALFSQMDVGGVDDRMTAMKLYSCQIYDNGTKVRDFIPCVNPEGYFGLYDTVGKTFYKSANTHQFTGKVIIPEEYTWMDGIYTGGSAYIDTGFYPNPTTTRAIMELTATGGVSVTRGVFGARAVTGNVTANSCNAFLFNGGWRIDWLNNGTSAISTAVEGERCRIECIGNYVNLNGTETTSTTTKGTDDLAYSFYIGTLNDVGTAYSSKFIGTVHTCILCDAEGVERLLVPCVYGDVYGMYDVVHGVFYSSAGDSQFGDTPVEYDFDYTGAVQSMILDAGTYQLEVWGAQGGAYSGSSINRGGYSVGTLSLAVKTKLYIYVGGQPTKNTSTSTGTKVSGGFNGGGKARTVYYSNTYTYGQGGGGGTDIRIGTDSLYARVIVAGGGAGASSSDTVYKIWGGGISGGNGYMYSFGGTISSGGSYATQGTFGQGADADSGVTNYKYVPSGGGGGWYGGGSSSIYSNNYSNYRYLCGGGSGYVYTSENASYYPSGCLLNSSYYLTSASTTSGSNETTFPSPSGGTENGHSGNGYCRITKI